MSEVITLEGGEALDVSAYPLPAGITDETLNMNGIAKAMHVSTVTIGRWMDLGMPVLQSGGNGRAYEFQLSHVYAWRMWREEGESREQRRKDDIAEQMAMHFLGGEEQVPDVGRNLSPRDMREYAEAEIKRNMAAEQRRELVRVHQVEAVLEDVLVAYRGAVSNLPDWLEQEFSLSPSQVEKAQRFCDAILEETRHRIARAGFRSGEVVSIDSDVEVGEA